MRRRNRDEKNSEKVDLKKELEAAKQMVLEKDDKLKSDGCSVREEETEI